LSRRGDCWRKHSDRNRTDYRVCLKVASVKLRSRTFSGFLHLDRVGAGAIYGWRNDGTHSIGSNTTRPLSSGGAKGTDRVRTTGARVFQEGTTRAGCRVADPAHKNELNGQAAACNCQELAVVSRAHLPRWHIKGKLKPPFGAAFFFVSEAASVGGPSLETPARGRDWRPFSGRSTSLRATCRRRSRN
jgi:hypothetical protein